MFNLKMINEKYLNQALRIRKDYLKTNNNLLGLQEKLEQIQVELKSSLNGLTQVKDNSESYDNEEEFRKDVLKYLKDFEIQIKEINSLYEPLNNKMENLKEEEDKLYSELIKKYPKIKEEEIINQVKEYVKNNE